MSEPVFTYEGKTFELGSASKVPNRIIIELQRTFRAEDVRRSDLNPASTDDRPAVWADVIDAVNRISALPPEEQNYDPAVPVILSFQVWAALRQGGVDISYSAAAELVWSAALEWTGVEEPASVPTKPRHPKGSGAARRRQGG